MTDQIKTREFSMMDVRKTYENESRIMVLEVEMRGITKALENIQNNHLKHIQGDIVIIKEWIAKNTPQNKLISKVFEYVAFLITAAVIALIIKQ